MFADPRANLNHLNISPGMSVADFGAGSGAYTMILAERLRPDGKVYAIDVQKDLLERLKTEATNRQLGNVSVIWGDIEAVGGSKLADRSVDAVIVSNVLFQAENRYSLAREAFRILRPGGQVLMVDWTVAPGLGADQSVGAETAKKIFTEAGLSLVEEFDAGGQHYGLVFKK